MEQVKAPEKLYVSSKQRPDKEIFYGTCTKVESNDIEYTRTDAFIEKACSWLENNLQGIVGGSIYVEDFRKYMEE